MVRIRAVRRMLNAPQAHFSRLGYGNSGGLRHGVCFDPQHRGDNAQALQYVSLALPGLRLYLIHMGIERYAGDVRDAAVYMQGNILQKIRITVRHRLPELHNHAHRLCNG